MDGPLNRSCEPLRHSHRSEGLTGNSARDQKDECNILGVEPEDNLVREQLHYGYF